jgi:hypothetical protein
MMLELKYVLPLLPNPKTCYIVFIFVSKVGVALPVLGGHIIEKQFLAMWIVEDLEWKTFLAYSIICCYIQYHQPRGYEML